MPKHVVWGFSPSKFLKYGVQICRFDHFDTHQELCTSCWLSIFGEGGVTERSYHFCANLMHIHWGKWGLAAECLIFIGCHRSVFMQDMFWLVLLIHLLPLVSPTNGCFNSNLFCQLQIISEFVFSCLLSIFWRNIVFSQQKSISCLFLHYIYVSCTPSISQPLYICEVGWGFPITTHIPCQSPPLSWHHQHLPCHLP